MFWACAQTESQRESVAERHLKLAGFSTYLPKIRVERRGATANGHEAGSEVPLFPSYLFLHVASQWHAVNSIIGVVHLLLDGEHPARLPEGLIEGLRAREDPDGLIILPVRPAFVRGDRVRVIRGALQGQLAIFAGMKPRARVELLLSIFGAQRTVEMKRRDIRRV